MHDASPLSLEHIAEAARDIDPVFLHTPQFVSDALGDQIGPRILCKLECVNPIRSFKGRGADYFLQSLANDGAAADQLVCASAGNFGQGLAYASARHGRAITVFAARSANLLKVERMRRQGAAGLAGCLLERDRWHGGTLAVPLCGGNMTAAQVRAWLRNG